MDIDEKELSKGDVPVDISIHRDLKTFLEEMLLLSVPPEIRYFWFCFNSHDWDTTLQTLPVSTTTETFSGAFSESSLVK